MACNQELAKRLNEVLLEGHWIANSNYKEQIESLKLHQATQSIGNLNSIAALVFHINYYLGGLLNVFQGGGLEIRDIYSFDLTPLNSEADWKNLKDEFLNNANKIIRVVEAMQDERLNKTFVDEKYGSYLRNIEGIIEHAYYHLGQIVIIKKIIAGQI